MSAKRRLVIVDEHILLLFLFNLPHSLIILAFVQWEVLMEETGQTVLAKETASEEAAAVVGSVL